MEPDILVAALTEEERLEKERSASPRLRVTAAQFGAVELPTPPPETETETETEAATEEKQGGEQEIPG